MKKIVGLLAIILTAAFLPAVSANQKPSIVIIDTAIDASKVTVAHEVCIMKIEGEFTCPNNKYYMEGPGAATLPASEIYATSTKTGRATDFDHGTIMTTLASVVNRDMNIIFVRIVGKQKNQEQGFYDDRLLNEALVWSINNKTKFNIVAVSASLGAWFNTCPINRPSAKQLRQSIVSLQSMEVATMFPAGNDGRNNTSYPACIPEAVSVGNVNTSIQGVNYINPRSNIGNDVDFYALGEYRTTIRPFPVNGTSSSNAVLAAYWVKSYKGSYKATFDYLKSIGQNVSQGRTTTNSFVDVLGK
jgi:hypothetical protein